MRTLGVVIPCYRQERFLPRTLAALDATPAGWALDGVLVLAAPPEAPLPALRGSWRAITPPKGNAHAPLTPGAARMAGFEACGGEWVLFVDADVEIDAPWLSRALEVAEASGSGSRLAGLWGRIEEWFVDAGRERPGSPDLYHVGAEERAVPYLATLALYRRSALLDAGGYDARLRSEEDFELGLRLRERGWTLRSLSARAARHWSAPRPSFAELSRRWRTGLCFGQGQVLRLYLGRRGFGTLLCRQSLYIAVLALWALGAAAAAVAATHASARPLLAWLAMLSALLAFMALRKRSPRLAAHALLSWTLNGLGMLVGWFRIDRRVRPGVGC